MHETLGKNTPLGRAGQPVELAPAHALLASDEGSYTTGVLLPVTGGMPMPQAGAHGRYVLMARNLQAFWTGIVRSLVQAGLDMVTGGTAAGRWRIRSYPPHH